MSVCSVYCGSAWWSVVLVTAQVGSATLTLVYSTAGSAMLYEMNVGMCSKSRMTEVDGLVGGCMVGGWVGDRWCL